MATGISLNQPVREGIEAVNRQCAEAPHHTDIPRPRLMRDDFHNRERDAAACTRLEGSAPLGYLARESLYHKDNTQGDRPSLLSEGTRIAGARKQAETAPNQGTTKQPRAYLYRKRGQLLE